MPVCRHTGRWSGLYAGIPGGVATCRGPESHGMPARRRSGTPAYRMPVSRHNRFLLRETAPTGPRGSSSDAGMPV